MRGKPHDTPARPAGQVVSFVQVASPLLYSGLDPHALHLYLILLDRSWRHGCCWPSDRTIGGWLGGPGRPRSPDTVNRVFKKLEAAGLVVRTKVPCTGDNPSGRLITVYGKVQAPRKSAAAVPADPRRQGAANLRDGLIREKKTDGPPAPASGAAPGETAEERIAGVKRRIEAVRRWPAMHRAAMEELAALETEVGTAPRASGSG